MSILLYLCSGGDENTCFVAITIHLQVFRLALSCSYLLSLGQIQERKSLNRIAIIESHGISLLASHTQNKELSRFFAHFKV